MMMIMMSRFVERIMNGPQTRCRFAAAGLRLLNCLPTNL